MISTNTIPIYSTKKTISSILIFVFLLTTVVPPQSSFAQSTATSTLPGAIIPAPGSFVGKSPAFTPPILTGITLNLGNPLNLDFVIDTGDNRISGKKLESETNKLIKYFLASLTIPEDEMWVNLSPYESNRIIPKSFGSTEMGRDLLAQDYMLKQLSSSLTHPDNEMGSEFWDRVYEKAYEKYGTTEIPVNTFNKIWIVPEKAVIFEKDASAFVVDSKLKVLTDLDYLSITKNQELQLKNNRQTITNSIIPNKESVSADKHEIIEDSSIAVHTEMTSSILKEIIIPAIEEEINEGKNFAQLRQIYNSVILATWYKQNLKESLIGRVYVNQNKILGIKLEDKEKQKDTLPSYISEIYDQYVEAFKIGVYDLIKEDYSPKTQEIIPKKYFSGGANLDAAMTVETKTVLNHVWIKEQTERKHVVSSVDFAQAAEIPPAAATMANSEEPILFDGNLTNLKNVVHPKREELRKLAREVVGPSLSEIITTTNNLSKLPESKEKQDKLAEISSNISNILLVSSILGAEKAYNAALDTLFELVQKHFRHGDEHMSILAATFGNVYLSMFFIQENRDSVIEKVQLYYDKFLQSIPSLEDIRDQSNFIYAQTARLVWNAKKLSLPEYKTEKTKVIGELIPFRNKFYELVTRHELHYSNIHFQDTSALLILSAILAKDDKYSRDMDFLMNKLKHNSNIENLAIPSALMLYIVSFLNNNELFEKLKVDVEGALDFFKDDVIMLPLITALYILADVNKNQKNSATPEKTFEEHQITTPIDSATPINSEGKYMPSNLLKRVEDESVFTGDEVDDAMIGEVAIRNLSALDATARDEFIQQINNWDYKAKSFFSSNINSRNVRGILTYQDNKLAGAFLSRIATNKSSALATAYAVRVFVNENARGQGLSRIMFDELVTDLKQQGVTQFLVGNDKNHIDKTSEAQGFAKMIMRHGYSRLIEQGLYPDGNIKWLRMSVNQSIYNPRDNIKVPKGFNSAIGELFNNYGIRFRLISAGLMHPLELQGDYPIANIYMLLQKSWLARKKFEETWTREMEILKTMLVIHIEDAEHFNNKDSAKLIAGFEEWMDNIIRIGANGINTSILQNCYQTFIRFKIFEMKFRHKTHTEISQYFGFSQSSLINNLRNARNNISMPKKLAAIEKYFISALSEEDSVMANDSDPAMMAQGIEVMWDNRAEWAPETSVDDKTAIMKRINMLLKDSLVKIYLGLNLDVLPKKASAEKQTSKTHIYSLFINYEKEILEVHVRLNGATEKQFLVKAQITNRENRYNNTISSNFSDTKFDFAMTNADDSPLISIDKAKELLDGASIYWPQFLGAFKNGQKETAITVLTRVSKLLEPKGELGTFNFIKNFPTFMKAASLITTKGELNKDLAELFHLANAAELLINGGINTVKYNYEWLKRLSPMEDRINFKNAAINNKFGIMMFVAARILDRDVLKQQDVAKYLANELGIENNMLNLNNDNYLDFIFDMTKDAVFAKIVRLISIEEYAQILELIDSLLLFIQNAPKALHYSHPRYSAVLDQVLDLRINFQTQLYSKTIAQKILSDENLFWLQNIVSKEYLRKLIEPIFNSLERQLRNTEGDTDPDIMIERIANIISTRIFDEIGSTIEERLRILAKRNASQNELGEQLLADLETLMANPDNFIPDPGTIGYTDDNKTASDPAMMTHKLKVNWEKANWAKRLSPEDIGTLGQKIKNLLRLNSVLIDLGLNQEDLPNSSRAVKRTSFYREYTLDINYGKGRLKVGTIYNSSKKQDFLVEIPIVAEKITYNNEDSSKAGFMEQKTIFDFAMTSNRARNNKVDSTIQEYSYSEILAVLENKMPLAEKPFESYPYLVMGYAVPEIDIKFQVMSKKDSDEVSLEDYRKQEITIILEALRNNPISALIAPSKTGKSFMVQKITEQKPDLGYLDLSNYPRGENLDALASKLEDKETVILDEFIAETDIELIEMLNKKGIKNILLILGGKVTNESKKLYQLNHQPFILEDHIISLKMKPLNKKQIKEFFYLLDEGRKDRIGEGRIIDKTTIDQNERGFSMLEFILELSEEIPIVPGIMQRLYYVATYKKDLNGLNDWQRFIIEELKTFDAGYIFSLAAIKDKMFLDMISHKPVIIDGEAINLRNVIAERIANIDFERINNKSPDKSVINSPKSSTDPAMASELSTDQIGGIDLNPNTINIENKGKTISFDMLDVDIKPFLDGDFQGFEPVIINITPVTSFPMLLGLKEYNYVKPMELSLN